MIDNRNEAESWYLIANKKDFSWIASILYNIKFWTEHEISYAPLKWKKSNVFLI